MDGSISKLMTGVGMPPTSQCRLSTAFIPLAQDWVLLDSKYLGRGDHILVLIYVKFSFVYI